MNKAYEIVTAWATFARPSKSMLKKAHERYDSCKDCTYNSGGAVEMCSECICPIQIKIFTLKTPKDKNCPKGYWKV